MNEHETMISCPCHEPDRLTVLCLACGKVHAPDPSWVVVALSAVFMAFQALRWMA